MAMLPKSIETSEIVGGLFGDVLNVVSGVSDYKEARKQGNSKGRALGKAAVSFAWGEFFYGGVSDAVVKGLSNVPIKAISNHAVGWSIPVTMALTMAPAAASLVSSAAQHGSEIRTRPWANRGQLGSGYFNMSEAGYTMRQRSLNAIRQNGINTRSVLGNEARTYARW